jgi:hypothetical protein
MRVFPMWFMLGTHKQNVLTLTLTGLVPSAWGYNWAALFLGEITTETWASRLGESDI